MESKIVLEGWQHIPAELPADDLKKLASNVGEDSEKGAQLAHWALETLMGYMVICSHLTGSGMKIVDFDGKPVIHLVK